MGCFECDFSSTKTFNRMTKTNQILFDWIGFEKSLFCQLLVKIRDKSFAAVLPFNLEVAGGLLNLIMVVGFISKCFVREGDYVLCMLWIHKTVLDSKTTDETFVSYQSYFVSF